MSFPYTSHLLQSLLWNQMASGGEVVSEARWALFSVAGHAGQGDLLSSGSELRSS
jgi:hypothetical protein